MSFFSPAPKIFSSSPLQDILDTLLMNNKYIWVHIIFSFRSRQIFLAPILAKACVRKVMTHTQIHTSILTLKLFDKTIDIPQKVFLPQEMALSSHECPPKVYQQMPRGVRVAQPFLSSIWIWRTVRHNYACKKKRVLCTYIITSWVCV